MAKSKNIGFDWDGVADQGIFEDGAIIITGESSEMNEEIIQFLLPKKVSKIYNYPYDDLDESSKSVKIGIWKAKTIKSLGIEKYYDDDEDVINIVNELSLNTITVKVVDGVPQEKMNFIVFTCDGSILPVAHKLEKEGNRVIVGIIENKKDILLPTEEYKTENPEKKKIRLSIYDGLLDKFSADEVLKIAKRIKDKENWIVLTDSNSNFKYTQKALEMGFTKGIFPTQEDREMEVDRTKAKEFVKQHYPDIKVAEVQSFSKIQEGIEFLNQSEEIWVLKSQGDCGDTVCPDSDDPEIAREELTAALEEMKKDYETNGFILEQKIQDVIELTPEAIFVDGTLVMTSLDIENKGIAAGNTGVQTGCMQNLIIRTEIEDRINKIAFPEIVHEMAKERTGLFIWDLSILIDNKGDMYFGEYCSQRFGWDSFPTELTMSADNEGKISNFFASLIYKKTPLRKKFGSGVRLLNIGSNGHLVEGTVSVKEEAQSCTYFYEIKEEKGELTSTISGWDFACVTGASDDVYDAIKLSYEYADMVMFEGKYIRPKFDFTSYDYNSAIMNRYQYAISHGLISSDDENIGISTGRNY